MATGDFFRKDLIFILSKQAPKQHGGKTGTLTSARVAAAEWFPLCVSLGGPLVLPVLGTSEDWLDPCMEPKRDLESQAPERTQEGRITHPEQNVRQFPTGQGWPARKLSMEHNLQPSQVASDPGGNTSTAQPVGSLSRCAHPGWVDAYTAPVPNLAWWCQDVVTSHKKESRPRGQPRAPSSRPTRVASQA